MLELAYKVVPKTTGLTPVRVQVPPLPPFFWSGMNEHEKRVKQEFEYVEFLKKRLNSTHYKASVPKKEYEKTKQKYDKEKLVLKILKGS